MHIQPSLGALSIISVKEFQKMIQSDASESEVKEKTFMALAQHESQTLKVGLSNELAQRIDAYAQERQSEITKCARGFTNLVNAKEEFYEFQPQFRERRKALTEVKQLYIGLRHDLDNPVVLEKIQIRDEKVLQKLGNISYQPIRYRYNPTTNFKLYVTNLKNIIEFIQNNPRTQTINTLKYIIQFKDASIEEIEDVIKEENYEMSEEMIKLLQELSLGITKHPKPYQNKSNRRLDLKTELKEINVNLSYYNSFHKKREEFVEYILECLAHQVPEEKLQEYIQRHGGTCAQDISNLFNRYLPQAKEHLPEALKKREEEQAKEKAEKEARITENQLKLLENLKTFLSIDEEMRNHPEYKKFIEKKEMLKELSYKVATYCPLDEMKTHKSLSEEAKSIVERYYSSIDYSKEKKK